MILFPSEGDFVSWSYLRNMQKKVFLPWIKEKESEVDVTEGKEIEVDFEGEKIWTTTYEVVKEISC